MSKRFLPEIVLISISFVWGITFVVVQDAIKDLPPYSFLAIRFLVAFLLLWLVNKIFIKQNVWNKAAILSGIGIGFFLFLGFSLQTFSLLYTTSGKSGFFTGMNVAFVPFVTLLFFQQRIKFPTLIGILCSIIGLYFLSGSIVGMNLGDILALGCAVAFAIQIALTGQYTKKLATYPFVIWQLLTVTVCSGILAAFYEPFHPTVLLRPTVWTAVLVTSAFATVFAFVGQTLVQKKISSARVAIIFTLEPVFAALGDYLVNEITLSGIELIGCSSIIIGIILAEIPWKIRKKESVVTLDLD
jgi:drug/metabolite transporter (DMT)-like permease